MRIYKISFADQKTCRCIVMEPQATTELDKLQIVNNFHPSYVVGVERVIPSIPDRLPWKRCGDHWEMEGFKLCKDGDGLFSLSWRGGSVVSGDKDVISQAVRDNWSAALA